MRMFFLEKIKVLSVKEALLLKAGEVFSRAADDLVLKKQDESYAWKAFAAYCEDLSSIKDQSKLEDVRGILENEKSLYTYMDFIKRRDQKAFESEMRAFKREMKEDVSDIKAQNKRLDEQNTQLLERNRVLEIQGVRATRLSLALFALSVVVSFTPLIAKKLGYDLDPPEKPVVMECPKPIVIEAPKYDLFRFDYRFPDHTKDTNKSLPPANDHRKEPVLLPRDRRAEANIPTP